MAMAPIQFRTVTYSVTYHH